MQDAVYWINKLTNKNGIGNEMIPSAIMLGAPIVDWKHLKIIFGLYAQVF